MTKLATVLVAGALALTACGSDDKTDSSTDSTTQAKKSVKVGLAFDIGGKGDKSFNDSALAGLDKAAADLKVETKALSAKANEPDTDKEERLRLLANGGFNPVIAVGFAYAAPLTKVAKEFPDVKFQIIDSTVDAANVEGHVFAAEQGSFLVGAVAALKSTTGNVGFVGGCTVPLIQTFQAGYEAGAEAAKAGTKVQVKYLSTPAQKCSGFNDPAAGKTTATGMYEGGADVIYQVAGGSGTGVFQAASAAEAKAIGVDSDQYNSADASIKAVIISSMLKRVDNAVFDFVERVSKDQFKAGAHNWDLKNDGVGYSTSGGAIDDIKAQVEALKAKIISGEIKVPTAPKG
ncbi:MAG: BMP family ABC transporter substrate-binding protein [Sporichthyaceae bacterium]